VSGAPALVLSLLLLGLTLGAAVIRPPRVPEAAVAAAGAGLVVVTGSLSLSQALAAVRELAPTVGFLAALLLIAEGCRREGLFAAIGDLIARHCAGRSRRLLGLVFLVASLVTIVLGLDATVVLLPPIVLVTVRRLRADPRAPLYACTHLANSASLLLPVSNLTNLLAFHASRLSFMRFAVLMTLPTVAAIAVEWFGISRRFAVAGREPSPVEDTGGTDAVHLPRFPLVVLGLTLIGFAISSVLDVAPVWIAVAGAIAMTAPVLAAAAMRPPGSLGGLVNAVEPGFLVFVLGLGVIVAAASRHGLGAAVSDLLPNGAALPDLLLIAILSGVLANLVNNIPATLILLPVAVSLGTGPVLAMLVGVNIGPNLTPAGSLATLLWRRVLRSAGVELDSREFFELGVLTVPAGLVLATIGVWLTLAVGL
jgi:arsenical pump membrane protein